MDVPFACLKHILRRLGHDIEDAEVAATVLAAVGEYEAALQQGRDRIRLEQHLVRALAHDSGEAGYLQAVLESQGELDPHGALNELRRFRWFERAFGPESPC